MSITPKELRKKLIKRAGEPEVVGRELKICVDNDFYTEQMVKEGIDEETLKKYNDVNRAMIDASVMTAERFVKKYDMDDVDRLTVNIPTPGGGITTSVRFPRDEDGNINTNDITLYTEAMLEGNKGSSELHTDILSNIRQCLTN